MAFDAHSSAAPTPPAPITPEVPTPPSTPDPAPPSAPAEAPIPLAASDVAPKIGDEAPPAPPAEEWKPEFKFKVRDQEHEIPEFLRSVATDKEKLAQLVDLHTRAFGLDDMKPRHEAVKTQLGEVSQQYKKVLGDIESVREAYKQGDLDSVFGMLQIPEQKILQWLEAKAHYLELPPEQRQVMDQRKAAEDRARSLEKENTQFQQQFQEQVGQARMYQLQLTLEKPEVRSFAEQFDSRTKPGSFQEEVRKHGEMTWYASGGKIDLTPEQAVSQVMEHYRRLLPSSQSMPAHDSAPASRPTEKVVQAPKQAQTLPNVAGKANPPSGSSKPKSIEDLKKRYREMAGISG